ncbi:MAG: choice-of-anchor Q domain-containing protein [Planctomycetia bacterium]|nr:choice-of-anchor Q domain-containing protein [Planctomycetia bacterium]
MSLFSRINAKVKNAVVSSGSVIKRSASGEARQNRERKQWFSGRSLRLEPLEDRQLLSVTTVDYEELELNVPIVMNESLAAPEAGSNISVATDLSNGVAASATPNTTSTSSTAVATPNEYYADGTKTGNKAQADYKSVSGDFNYELERAESDESSPSVGEHYYLSTSTHMETAAEMLWVSGWAQAAGFDDAESVLTHIKANFEERFDAYPDEIVEWFITGDFSKIDARWYTEHDAWIPKTNADGGGFFQEVNYDSVGGNYNAFTGSTSKDGKDCGYMGQAFIALDAGTAVSAELQYVALDNGKAFKYGLGHGNNLTPYAGKGTFFPTRDSLADKSSLVIKDVYIPSRTLVNSVTDTKHYAAVMFANDDYNITSPNYNDEDPREDHIKKDVWYLVEWNEGTGCYTFAIEPDWLRLRTADDKGVSFNGLVNSDPLFRLFYYGDGEGNSFSYFIERSQFSANNKTTTPDIWGDEYIGGSPFGEAVTYGFNEGQTKPFFVNMAFTGLEFLANYSAKISPYALEDTYSLQSYKGAPNTIYLDFTTIGLDSHNATASFQERIFIQEVWQRVAEDFMPFNVNVTTDAAVKGSGSYISLDVGTGLTRNYLNNNLNGVAPSASESGLTLNTTLAKITAEGASASIGGALGLSSDAYLLNEEAYPGRDKWGPIMGNPNSQAKQYTQWSQGEYASAEGAQDEVAMIASRLGYRVDDFGNTLADAQDLSDFLVDVYWQYDPLISLYENYNEWKNQYAKIDKYSSSQGTYLVSGVIGRSEDENGGVIYDQDVFSFVSSGGSYVIDVSTIGADMRWNSAPNRWADRASDYYYAFDWWMTNLNVKVELLNSRGEIIQFYDPLTTSFTHFTTGKLAEGETFYIKVYGIGEGNALTNGFSDYGSMGSYTLSVTENLEDFVVRYDETGGALDEKDPYYNAIVVTTLEDSVAMDGKISLREALSYIGRRLEDGSFVGTTIVFSDELLSTDKTFYFGNDNNGDYRGELYLNYELSGKTTTLDAQYFYHFADPNVAGDTSHRVMLGEGDVKLDAGTNITIDARLKLEDGTIQNASGRVLQVDNITAEIRGFVITGGNATTDNDFPDVQLQYGGGIYNNYGWLTVKDSIIAGNSALKGGGGIYNTGGYAPMYYPDMTGNEYDFNDAFGKLTILNSEIIGNRTTYNGDVSSSSIGGGIFNYFTGELDMYNCTVAGNLSVWSGGGLENNGRANIYNSLFANNYADRGNDIFTEKDAFNNNGGTNVYYSLIRDKSIDNDYNTYNYGNTKGKKISEGTGTKAGTRTNPIEAGFILYKDYAVYKVNADYLGYGIVSMILDADKIQWSADLWKDWNLSVSASSVAIDLGNQAYYTESEYIVDKWTTYWNTNYQKDREADHARQYTEDWNNNWATGYGVEFGNALTTLMNIGADTDAYYTARDAVDAALVDLDLGYTSLAQFLPTLGDNGLVTLANHCTVDISTPVKFCLALNNVEYGTVIDTLVKSAFADAITAKIQTAINSFIATDKTNKINEYNAALTNLNNLFSKYVWNDAAGAYYTSFNAFLARQGNYMTGTPSALAQGSIRFRDKADLTKYVTFDISNADKFYSTRTTAGNSGYFKDIDLCILTGYPQKGTTQDRYNPNNARPGIMNTDGALWDAMVTSLTAFQGQNTYANALNDMDNLYVRMFGSTSGFGEFLVANSPIAAVSFDDASTAPQIFYQNNTDVLRGALALEIQTESVNTKFFTDLRDAYVAENVNADRQTEVATLIIKQEAKYDLGRKDRIVGKNIDAGAFEYQGTADPVSSQSDFSEFAPKTTNSEAEYDWNSSAIASKTQGDRVGFGVSGTETKDGDEDVRKNFVLEPDTTSNVIAEDESVYLNFSFTNLDGATVGQKVLDDALAQLLAATTTNTTEYDAAIANCNTYFSDLLNGMNFVQYLNEEVKTLGDNVDVSDPGKLHAAFKAGSVALTDLQQKFVSDGFALFGTLLNDWLYSVSVNATSELKALEDIYYAWLGKDADTNVNIDFSTFLTAVGTISINNTLSADISTPKKFRTLVLDWSKLANSEDEKVAETWTNNLAVLMNKYNLLLAEAINNVSATPSLPPVGWKVKLAYCLANNTGLGTTGFFYTDASWAVATEKMDELYTAWFGKDLNTFLAGKSLTGGTDISSSEKLYNALKGNTTRINEYNALVADAITATGTLPFNTYVNFTRSTVKAGLPVSTESLFTVMISPSYANPASGSELKVLTSDSTIFGGELRINGSATGSVKIGSSGNLTVDGTVVGTIRYAENGLITIEDLNLGTLDRGAYLFMMELNPDSGSAYLPSSIPVYTRINETSTANNKSYVKIQVAEQLVSDPIVVTTESDVNNPFDGLTSLREAIRAAGSQYTKEYEIASGNYIQVAGTDEAQGPIYYVEGDKVYNVEKGDYLKTVEQGVTTDVITEIADGTTLFLYEDTVILLQIEGTSPAEARYDAGTVFTYNAEKDVFVMENGSLYRFMEGTKLVLNSVHVGGDFWYTWTGERRTEVAIPEGTYVSSTFDLIENISGYDKAADPVTFVQTASGYYIRTGTAGAYVYQDLAVGNQVKVSAGETVFKLNENSVRVREELTAELTLTWQNGYWSSGTDLYALKKGTDLTFNGNAGTYEIVKSETISPEEGDILLSADQQTVYGYYDAAENKFYTDRTERTEEYVYDPLKSVTYSIRRTEYPSSAGQILTYKDRNVLKQTDTLGSVILFDASVFNQPGKEINLVAENGKIIVEKSITIDASQFVVWNDATKTWDPAVSTDLPVTVSGQDAIQIFTFGSNKISDINITINNMVLQNGFAEFERAENGFDIIGGGNGGAIENYGNLTLNNCTVQNNMARQYGAGIYSTGSLTMNNSAVVKNKIEVVYEKYNTYPEAYGAGVYSQSDQNLIMDNVSFTGNTIVLDYQNVNINVKAGGAGLYSAGTTIITGSTDELNPTKYENNTVSVNPIDPKVDASGTFTGYGAGLAVVGDLELSDIEFSENSLIKGTGIVNTLYGGALYVSGNAVISGINAANNSAMIGGGIAAENGKLELSDSIIMNNTGELYGAGLYTTAVAVIDQSVISKNQLTINCSAAEESNWVRTIGGAGIWSAVKNVSALDPNDSTVLKIYNSEIEDNETIVTIDPAFGYGVDLTVRGGGIYVENGFEMGGALGTSVSGNKINVNLGTFDRDNITGIKTAGAGIYNAYTLDPSVNGSVSVDTIVSGSNIQENTIEIKSDKDLSVFNKDNQEIISSEGAGLYRSGLPGTTGLYIDNSRIGGNSASFSNTAAGTETIFGRGGAAYLLNETAFISNSVFGMNAAAEGAAFYNAAGALALYNVTVGVNGAAAEKGGSISNTGSLALFNSIVAQTRDASDWENTLGDQRLDIISAGGSVAVSASMIGWAEETEDWTVNGTCFIGSDANIIDPFFKVDLAQTFQTVKTGVLAENGLQLTSTSYGIDVGINENAIQMTPNGQIALEYDILGNARIFNGTTAGGQIYIPIVDLGAYEFAAIVYSDLAFTTPEVSVNPANPSTATEVTVNFTGINLGPAIIFRSFDYQIHLYKQIDGEYVEINKGQYIETKELSSTDFLAENGTFSVNDYSLGFLGEGNYIIRIYLDVNNTVLESTKLNNWSDFNGVDVDFEVKLSNEFIVNTEEDIVDPDDGKTSLREAILSAANEGIDGGIADIRFSSDLKGKTIVLQNGQIEIPYNNATFDGHHLTVINIDASSIGGITIDAQNKSRIFSISNNITDKTITQTGGVFLKGITFINGNSLVMAASESPMQGGAINNAYKLTVEDCTFKNNTAKDGSAIRNVGDLTVLNSVIVENTATGNGAIFNGGTNNIGNVTIIGSMISGNDSGTGYGGAVSHQGTSLIIRDSDLSGNSAGFGGGVALVSGNVEIENSTLAGNYAKGTVDENGKTVLSGQGGGIFSIIDFTLTDSIVTGNKAAVEADIYAKPEKWSVANNVNNLIGTDPVSLFTSFASYTTWNKNLYKSWNLQLLDTATAAIDKGTTTRTAAAQDAAGNPRIVNAIIDIGAYEYQGEGKINIITASNANAANEIPVVSTDSKIEAGTEITTFGFRAERRGTAVTYSIKADENADPLVEPLFIIDSATGNLTAAREIPDGLYSITILAKVDGVEDPYEAVYTIKIAPQTGLSQLVDTHLVTSTSVYLSWLAVDHADKYQIRYKKVGESDDAWTIYQNAAGQSFFYGTAATVNARFEIGATYIFQIKALSNDGYIDSDWSDQEREIVAAGSLLPGETEINPELLRWSSKQMVTIEYVLPTISVKSYEFADGQVLKLVINVGMNSQGRISQWFVNWGDQSKDQLPIAAAGTKLNAAHYYEKNGDFSITLKLIDTEGYGESFVYSLGNHVVDSYAAPAELPVMETIVSAADSSLPRKETITVPSESGLPSETAGSNYVQENALFFEELFGLRETSEKPVSAAELPIAASVLPSFTAERLSNRILRQHINQSIDSIYAEEDLDLIGDYGFEENIVSESGTAESSIYDELLTELK